MLAEPDVALTDWGLAVECGLFAWLGPRERAAPAPRRWLRLFFGSVAVAAFSGGLVHGLFPDGRQAPAIVLWRVTLLSIGVTALAAWGLGAWLLGPPSIARRVAVAAVAAFLVYGGVVLIVTDSFAVAMAAYVPGAVFLLGAFLIAWWRAARVRLLVAAAGLLVMLAGSWVQWAGVTVHPVYLSHNALYHVIQAIALALVFTGTRGLVTRPAERAACRA